MPSGSVKCNLPLIPLSNANKMVSVAQVEFGKYGSSLQYLKGCGHIRQWITVLDGDFVEASVIYAGPKTPILFSHKEKASSSGRCGLTNDPCCEGLLNVIVHSSTLGRRQGEDTTSGGTGTWKQVNGAVIRAVWW